MEIYPTLVYPSEARFCHSPLVLDLTIQIHIILANLF